MLTVPESITFLFANLVFQIDNYLKTKNGKYKKRAIKYLKKLIQIIKKSLFIVSDKPHEAEQQTRCFLENLEKKVLPIVKSGDTNKIREAFNHLRCIEFSFKPYSYTLSSLTKINILFEILPEPVEKKEFLAFIPSQIRKVLLIVLIIVICYASYSVATLYLNVPAGDAYIAAMTLLVFLVGLYMKSKF
jgi:hypothetical protein